MKDVRTPDTPVAPIPTPTNASTRRVHRRIEARNTIRASDVPGAFDFVLTGDTETDSILGVLASYLGAAACGHSLDLGLSIDVERVVVEVETPATRSDGGAVSPDPENDLGLSLSVPSRVRALVEARTDESTAALAPWRDRLVSDRAPFSMAPGLVGIDLFVTTLSSPSTERGG